MTYQYIRLAAGRLKRYRDAHDVVPCTEDGTPITCYGLDEDFYRFAICKVAGYEIKDNVMYCRLEGIEA